MELTTEAIREHVGVISFQLGREYFLKQRVVHLEMYEEDGSIHGHVLGSQKTPYEIDLTLEEGEIVDSDCDCPVGSACKHVAAVGLKALVQLSTTSKPKQLAQQTVQQRQRQWMEPLSQFVANDVRDEKQPFHLQILVRFERRYASGWSMSQLANSEQEEWEVAFRPRLLDPQTGKFSSTKLNWSRAYSGNYPIYWERDAVLKESHFVYLQLLASGMAGGYGAGWVSVSKTRAGYFWQILKQHQDYGVTILGGQKGNLSVVFSDTPLDAQLVVEDAGNGVRLRKQLTLQGKDISTQAIAIVGDPPVFAVSEHDAYSFYPLASGSQATYRFAEAVQIPKEDIAMLQEQFLPSLLKQSHVVSTAKAVTMPEQVDLTPTLALTQIGQAKIGVSTGMSYQEKTHFFPAIPEQQMVNGKGVLFKQESIDVVRKAFEQALPGSTRMKQLALGGIPAARFVAETIPQLQEQLPNLIIQKRDDLPVFTYDKSDAQVSYAVDESEESNDWFDLQVTVKIGKEAVPFAVLFAALSDGQAFLLLESGKYFSLNTPQFDKLKQLITEAKSMQEKEVEGIRLTRFQAGLWDELQQTGIVQKQSRRWQEAMNGLLSLKAIAMQAIPTTVQATLRNYQMEGYSWMYFLREHGLGGILADDMGLGKTVQTIAFMAKQKLAVGSKKPFLVVAPTSVVENWDTELEKFAPKLKKVILRAGDRTEQLAQISKTDVVVISYPLLVRDFDKLKKIQFDTIIFDEAQMVKNYQSKAYSLSRKLKAHSKLALTGTPMENNLMELWSICSLVAPGLFPTPEKFTQQYRTPIEKQQNLDALTKLRQRIRPFILRRQKSLVAQQLPAKNEQILRLTLNDVHKNLYQKQLQYERKRVLGLLDTGGLKEHRFEILRSLMRLRQLCLHPVLLDEKHHELPSTKLEALRERIEELVAEGHRVIIFSQFTSFLRLVKKMLDADKYHYLYLAGETKNRGELIKRFDTDTSIPIFLISLKAGGFGLNLTAADYCILLDPWWNPAVEQQAVDRTHRIGQTKPVFVYKFIAKDTIEEKVLALQEKKRKLFQNVLDKEGMFGSLITEDDIKSIFSE
ncbi:MAG: SNF2-related protein [Candidatus Levyibacteriota bacterium]